MFPRFSSRGLASTAREYRVLVSGASGMVGTALVESLERPKLSNYFRPVVHRLVRHEPGKDEVYWDPYEMRIDVEHLEGYDAVVHLAGENVGSGEGLFAPLGRWTERKKHNIMESRRRGTRLLSTALASLRHKPSVFVTASGIGVYGAKCGDRILDESAPVGDDFLAQVAQVWEAETEPARIAGIRTVHTRLGVVLSARGGVIQKLQLPFLLGLGGPIGDGNQYMSWISLNDAVRVIEHIIATPSIVGPINTCAPYPATSKEFAAALGDALHRPALIPLPTAVVETVFGEMGQQTLLASQRAIPKKLLDSGFRFIHPTIHKGCQAAVSTT